MAVTIPVQEPITHNFERSNHRFVAGYGRLTHCKVTSNIYLHVSPLAG